MRRPNPAIRPGEALAAWDAAQSRADEAPVTMKCTLSTPMYGGGVKPGTVDRSLPIRPSALRGQLRFWWRLLNGAGRESQEVFAAESELWGGIPSPVPRASRVILQVGGEPVESAQMVNARSSERPAYALILDRGEDPSLLRSGYEFTLALRFARGITGGQRKQVIEALRWWASFGGVGARTRRGLGAVTAIGEGFELKPVSYGEVESRGGRMVLRPPRENAIDAWRDAVDALKDFRQGRGLARNPGSGNRPGRSRWPEPDAIRRRTGHHARGHAPQHEVDGFYPRAAFGLPIVFHFKNRNTGDPPGTSNRDAPDPVLEPADGDRMASPLILRPYFDGDRHRPLALLLPGWAKRVSVSVDLDSKHVGPAWPEDPDERRRLSDLIGPLQGRGADALTAFMHYFERRESGGRHGHRRGSR